MKTKSILLSLFILFSFTALSAQGKKAKNTETVVFDVPMTCEACKKSIEGNISFEKGVKDLVVFLKDNKVSVTYDTRKTDVEKLQTAFEKIGRKATLPAAKELVEGDSTARKGSCCKAESKEAKAVNCSDTQKKEACADTKKEAACSAKKEAGSCSDAQKKASCCSAKKTTGTVAKKETAAKPRIRREPCCR